jgi:hypothetical protein
MVYSTVASSSYAAPTTTVNLNDTVLTDPITRVYVVATRDGLWPNGPGYVVARDYGTDRAALEAADAVAAATGKELRITAAFPIDDDVTLAAPKVTVQPGVPFAISNTKTLSISNYLDAGPYQIFSCTGTGKPSFSNPQTLYPEWWGAARNGVADDLPEFQACINSAAAGSLIKLTGGSYLLNGNNLDWPETNGLTFKGDGPGVTKVITANAAAYGIQVYGTGSAISGATIADMTIQGDDAATAVPQNHIAVAGTVSDLVIRNVEFKKGTQGGVIIAETATVSRLLVERCWLHDINKSTYTTLAGGVVYGRCGDDMTVRDCIFEDINGTPTNLIHAIYLFNGNRLKIKDNYFSGQSADVAPGYTGTTINDFQMTGNVSVGVKAHYLYYLTRPLIANNTSYGSGYAFAYGTAARFANNLCYGNFTGLAILTATYSQNGLDISGNTILNDVNKAIAIEQNATNILINGGNHIESTAGYYCAYLTTTGTVNVLDNYFASPVSGGNGIRVDGVGGGYACNNRFNLAAATYGIVSYAADPTLFKVFDNRLISATGALAHSSVTSLPLRGTATLEGATGTKAIVFNAALADASYQVTVTGGANETFYVTSKATTGFTINSSNATSTATVDYVVSKN